MGLLGLNRILRVHAEDAKLTTQKNRKERAKLFAVLCETLCVLCVNLHLASFRKIHFGTESPEFLILL